MRALALAAAALAGGCSMGAFDDLRDSASSESHSAPDGISVGFGADVAFVPSPPGLDGMRFVVAGDNGPSLSTFVYDVDNDEVTSAGIDLADFVANLDRPPVITGVENDFMGQANGLVAFGIGQLGAIVLLEAGSGRDDNPPVELGVIRSQDCGLPPNLPGFGEHMVFAETGAGEPAPDLVLAAGDNLVVIQDVNAGALDCASCRLPVRALGIAGIDLGNGPAREIVVAIDTPGQTQVEAFEVNDGILAQAGGDCLLDSGFSIPEPGYGDLVTTGNIDDDPRPEAIFHKRGRSEVAVWLNLDFSPPNQPVIAPTLADIADAASMAVVNVDSTGIGRGELLIGVPVDGEGNDDGRVEVFDLVSPPRLELRSTLRDSAPADGQLYGRSLATAGFRRGQVVTQLPIIGADEEVFAVFQADPEGEDPR